MAGTGSSACSMSWSSAEARWVRPSPGIWRETPVLPAVSVSASSIRQQFSTPLNIHLSRYGIGFLRQATKVLGVDLGLKEPGYLFLASASGAAVLRATHAIQKGEG